MVRHDGPMRILTTPSGLICAPLLDDPAMACLATGGRVASVTVADRDDITLADIETAAADYLRMSSGASVVGLGELTDLAEEMALNCTEIAADHPAGTTLMASYDVTADEWSYVPADDAEPAQVGAD